MTRDELRSAVLQSLLSVAPEAQPADLRADEPLREQLEIDSFDFLQFIIALARRLSVEIPEGDYGKLSTLDSSVAYLEARLPQR